jgi:hypothetical protein
MGLIHGVFGKLSTRRGAWAWFHDLWSLWKALHQEGCVGLIPWPLGSLESCPPGGVHGLDSMTFGLGVQKFLNIEWFLHIKLIRSWKFRRNWNVPLVLLERYWWAGCNGIWLVRFGFRMWQILIFKWFLSLKIQVNPKKSGFGRKNQLRMC